MSSFPPPNVYFNGIIYDSAYFTQSTGSGSGLTKVQANALYLQKNKSRYSDSIRNIFSRNINKFNKSNIRFY